MSVRSSHRSARRHGPPGPKVDFWHGRVDVPDEPRPCLGGIARDPGLRLRDVAERVGVTERAAQRIVTELVGAGYLERRREVGAMCTGSGRTGPCATLWRTAITSARLRCSMTTPESNAAPESSPYRGRVVAVGTKHGKQHQFAPAFHRVLGMALRLRLSIPTIRHLQWRSGSLARLRCRRRSRQGQARHERHRPAVWAGQRRSYGPLPGVAGARGDSAVLR